MEIRPVRDLAAFRAAFRVNRDAWRTAFDGIVADDVLEGFEVPADERLEERLEAVRETGFFLVALAAGGERPALAAGDPPVVGFAEVRTLDTESFVSPGEAELRALYVDPEHWGDGVGTTLLDAVESRLTGVEAADRPTADRLVLHTFRENEQGRSFYRRRGFEEVDESTFEVGGEEHETVVYARSL